MNEKAQVHSFVQNLLADKGDDQPFTDEDSLLLGGRLQSIDAVEIVVFLEEKFGIDFAIIGFEQEQIDSVDAICTLIQSTAVPAADPRRRDGNPYSKGMVSVMHRELAIEDVLADSPRRPGRRCHPL